MRNLRYCSQTETSTQDIAKNLAPLPDETCMETVYTFCQRQGRGQRGNAWFCGENTNIAATFVFDPVFLSAEHLFFLDMALSVGVLRYARAQGEDFFLKWPNDLYWKNKKAAGLLLENSVVSGKVKRVCFGIGLNVNQAVFPPGLPRPVSLFQIDGKRRDLQVEIEKLAENIHAVYGEFRREYKDGILQNIKAEYLESLLFKDRWRNFVYLGNRMEACIRNVDDNGHLELEKRNGGNILAGIKELEYCFDE